MPVEVLWEEVSQYFARNPQEIDANLLQQAREIERRYRITWWDSLIVAAAQSQDCDILLTEDLQDGMNFGGVTVRSPFTLEVREAAAAYAATPRPASPHRPRGRPPKNRALAANS